jgi:hypothetical protein
MVELISISSIIKRSEAGMHSIYCLEGVPDLVNGIL